MARILRKSLLISLAVLVLFGAVVGCGGSKKTTQQTSMSPTTSADMQPPKAWGEETRENILQGK